MKTIIKNIPQLIKSGMCLPGIPRRHNLSKTVTKVLAPLERPLTDNIHLLGYQGTCILPQNIKAKSISGEWSIIPHLVMRQGKLAKLALAAGMTKTLSELSQIKKREDQVLHYNSMQSKIIKQVRELPKSRNPNQLCDEYICFAANFLSILSAAEPDSVSFRDIYCSAQLQKDFNYNSGSVEDLIEKMSKESLDCVDVIHYNPDYCLDHLGTGLFIAIDAPSEWGQPEPLRPEFAYFYPENFKISKRKKTRTINTSISKNSGLLTELLNGGSEVIYVKTSSSTSTQFCDHRLTVLSEEDNNSDEYTIAVSPGISERLQACSHFSSSKSLKMVSAKKCTM